MAAPRGKAAEVQAEGTAQVDENTEAASLSPEERHGALANLLGAGVVAPDVTAEANPAEAPADTPVWSEETATVDPSGMVEAVVVFDRYQHNPGTGWVNARQGDTIMVTRVAADRGVRLGGLKVNG